MTDALLAEARLVVILGVADPGDSVPLLRSYLLQGGQVVIAAGGPFDPIAWQNAAWLEGAGILPAPLAEDFLGQLPEEATETLNPFRMAFGGRMLTDGFLYLGGASEETIRDLYLAPLFFRAVRPDVSPAALEQLETRERERISAELELLAEHQEELRRWDSKEGELSAEEEAARRQVLSQLSAIRPDWLLWENSQSDPLPMHVPAEEAERNKLIDTLVDRTTPEVLANFTDPAHAPYVLRRETGRGTVVFAGSGLLSSWNTLPRENAFLLFDRITCSLVQSTMPRHVYGVTSEIAIPLPTEERNVQVTLRRPEAESEEVLDAGFISRDQRGVTIAHPAARGRYDLRARRLATSDDPTVEEELWASTVVVNGDARESELEPLERAAFEERVGEGTLTWVGPEEEISLAGTAIYGQDLWKWLVGLVLALLMIELAILAWPHLRGGAEPTAAGGQAAGGTATAEPQASAG